MHRWSTLNCQAAVYSDNILCFAAELVSNTALLLGAIQENDQLQTSLQAVLQERNIAQDIRSILNYVSHLLHLLLTLSLSLSLSLSLFQCKKAGGLLGHRKDCITIPVDNVLSKLNKQSIPQRVKEIQALQLICEALLGTTNDQNTHNCIFVD